MSRHAYSISTAALPDRDPRPMADHSPAAGQYQLVIGWDPPLHTYFAMVELGLADPDAGPELPLWVGDAPDEIPTPEALAAAVADWVILTPAMLATLAAERGAPNRVR